MLLLWYGFDEDENISIGGATNIAPVLQRRVLDEELEAILLAQHLAHTFWKEDKKN